MSLLSPNLKEKWMGIALYLKASYSTPLLLVKRRNYSISL